MATIHRLIIFALCSARSAKGKNKNFIKNIL
jgi:hypothetical protein